MCDVRVRPQRENVIDPPQSAKSWQTPRAASLHSVTTRTCHGIHRNISTPLQRWQPRTDAAAQGPSQDDMDNTRRSTPAGRQHYHRHYTAPVHWQLKVHANTPLQPMQCTGISSHTTSVKCSRAFQPTSTVSADRCLPTSILDSRFANPDSASARACFHHTHSHQVRPQGTPTSSTRTRKRRSGRVCGIRERVRHDTRDATPGRPPAHAVDATTVGVVL